MVWYYLLSRTKRLRMKKTMLPFLFLLLAGSSNFCCKKAKDTLPVTTTAEDVTRPAATEATITVAKDGSGNYTTVQAAFNAVPNNSSTRTIINIKNGTYKEVLTLASTKKNVSIIGQSATGVKLTYDNYASKINPATGTAYGTSGSSSTFIRAEGFYAKNIVFENSSGPVGQALAIYISGDKAVFYNCRFLGRQDTWYAGNVRVYSKNCYIEGTTDFIFGAATAFFDGCNIYSYGGTAITAASTENYVTYGFVFNNCTVTGASGVSTLFGRTWRPYAATAFVNSSISSIIKAAGWSDWGNAANQATARYREYDNTGAGASRSGRVSWSRLLTSAEAANYTNFRTVLKTTYASSPVTDNWDPSTLIN
jgi:pectinesterase